MILAGDVGGTKVHLALYNFTNGNLQHTGATNATRPRTTAGLEEIVREFLGTDTSFAPPASVYRGRCAMAVCG